MAVILLWRERDEWMARRIAGEEDASQTTGFPAAVNANSVLQVMRHVYPGSLLAVASAKEAA